MANPKTAILLGGPTASGKTDIAHHLALKLGCAIVSVDSRQCITEFDIAVAKPEPSYLREVPYFFISTQSFTEHTDLQTFIQWTDKGVNSSFQCSDYVILAGGTGLYFKAWKDGIDDIPSVSSDVRRYVESILNTMGRDGLIRELQVADDPFLDTKESLNTARLMRALEVRLQTKQSILDFQQGRATKRDFAILEYALAPARDVLLKRIEERSQSMMKKGLWEEASNFYPYRHHKNLATVGYREIFEAIDRGKDEQWATEQINIHTRQYAKRQMTWFRNQGDYKILDPENAESTILSALGK